MRNPCKDCEHSKSQNLGVYKRYFCSNLDKMADCPKMQKYEKHKNATNKYSKGTKINSFEEMMKKEYVFINDRPVSKSFFKNMSSIAVQKALKRGVYECKSNRKKEKK